MKIMKKYHYINGPKLKDKRIDARLTQAEVAQKIDRIRPITARLNVKKQFRR